MPRINMSRMMLCGLVAGILLFCMEAMTHMMLLANDWKNWSMMMGGNLHAPSQMVSMTLWMCMCLINGMTGMWMYTGIRPRFGAGPRTACLAALMMWMVGWMSTALGQMAMGDIPQNITIMGCLCGLVACMVAMMAGCAMYREDMMTNAARGSDHHTRARAA